MNIDQSRSALSIKTQLLINLIVDYLEQYPQICHFLRVMRLKLFTIFALYV